MSISDFMEIEEEKMMLRKLSEGDEVAFRHIYTIYSPAIYANIRKMVIPPELAEDLLQEVFLALWINRYKINTEKSIGGWLFVVSYNKSISFLKKKLQQAVLSVSSFSDIEMSEEQPMDELSYASQISMLEEAIHHLSPRKREVFRLCHFEGKTYEEVAVALNISVSSVKDYLKQSSYFIKQYVHSNFMNVVGMSLLLFMLELL